MGRRIPGLEYRRDVVLSALLVLAATVPVVAQAPGGSSVPTIERRETIIGGKPAPTFERCVEVEIGRDSSFGCLNQMLRREADRVNPSINLPPIDARSPDVRIGNVNEAAVRQQYGANYGRSAIPFRPPTSTFVLPRR